MKKLIAALVASWAVGLAGCAHFRHVNAEPSVSTGLAQDREARMQAIEKDLEAKGYSEERARAEAARRVPLMETTYSESLQDIVTGAAAKRQVADERFKKDIAAATSGGN